LFYGDSDIEYWKSEDSFPDAINCGVGGSTAYEAAMHAQKTANKFLPKGHVVIVAGENDMMSALECPDTIFKTLKKAALAFANSRYHPTVIMFSTKPEPGTTELHSLYKKYDNLCKAFAETPEMKGHFKFVDAHSRFLGLGNSGLYDTDDLHMNQVGYGHWNTWLKEVIKDGCHDQLGKDGQAWKDADGDNCQSISDSDWCSSYDEYKVDDVGANQVCCACGGGSDDIPNWKDSDGDDCTKVVKGGHCQFADDFKVNGVGAKEACVGCGGGVKRHPLIS
jgi:lysophospholipase L1-like esterase